jgi:cytoskeletal protein RodZ
MKPEHSTRRRGLIWAAAAVIGVGAVVGIAGPAVGGDRGERAPDAARSSTPRPTAGDVEAAGRSASSREASSRETSSPATATGKRKPGTASSPATHAASSAAAPTATGSATRRGAVSLKADDAEKTLRSALVVNRQQPDTQAGFTAEAKQAAAGDYLAEAANQWEELDAYGWRVKGTPHLSAVKVTSADPAKHRAVVGACVDSSDVRFIDAKGKVVGGNAGRSKPARQIFTIELGKDGHWRVVDRTFPDNPAC